MGRDKALLEIDGVPLWQRQLQTLRQLNPEQLMISGASHPSSRAERSGVEGSRRVSEKPSFARLVAARRDPSTPPMAPLEMTIVDEFENAGPLAGVAAALRGCSAPRLVVLAVDLPWMTAGFLRALLESEETAGVVPRGPEFFEPLAAVYSLGCGPLAQAALQCGDFSMQNFVAVALAEKLVVARSIAPEEAPLFENWNSPEDL